MTPRWPDWRGSHEAPKKRREHADITGMRLFNNVDADRLAVLKPALREWISVILRTAEDWRRRTHRESDIPFWYGERAQLSLFAGALWRVNAMAFEEFSASKHRHGRKTNGRADIWFKIDGNEFIGEAKQMFINAASKQQRIKAKIREAIGNVREHQKSKAKRLAMVFATVELSARHCSEVDQCLQNWIDQAKGLGCDALAWAFPDGWHDFQPKKNGKVFPGCALLIKTV